mgnify:CR=1 FL=1
MPENPREPPSALPLHELEHAASLQRQGRWLEAAAVYERLALVNPDDHRLRANQGNALWLADLPAAAARAYRRALALDPTSHVSLRGLASCLRDLQQWPQALALHDQLRPLLSSGSTDDHHNRWARSQVLLGLQRWHLGFEAMAQRHADLHPIPVDPLAPQLRLESEQGFGDTFQYVRFLEPLLQRRRAAGVTGGLMLQVEPALVEVLRLGLGWLDDPPAIEAWSAAVARAASPTSGAASDPPKPPHLTLLELPGALGLNAVDPSGAYLRSPAWPGRTSASGADLRVGVCWASGRKLEEPFMAREYRKRSLPPEVLWRLLDALQQRGAELVPLQVGHDAHLGEALGGPLLPAPEAIQTFHGTAQLMCQLDRVVSVDTAVAHLCGALGVPGWILLPWSADPRWLDQGDATPWYSSLRLFRQPRPGDWHGAIDHLLAAWGAP